MLPRLPRCLTGRLPIPCCRRSTLNAASQAIGDNFVRAFEQLLRFCQLAVELFLLLHLLEPADTASIERSFRSLNQLAAGSFRYINQLLLIGSVDRVADAFDRVFVLVRFSRRSRSGQSRLA